MRRVAVVVLKLGPSLAQLGLWYKSRGKFLGKVNVYHEFRRIF